MAETKSKGGRPPEPNARRFPLYLRLNAAEKAALNRLIGLRNDDLRSENVTVKAADVLRWLVARELAALSAEERAPYLAMAKAARAAMPEPKPVPPPLVFNDAYNLKALLEAAGDRFTDQASVDRMENLLADLHQGPAPGESEEDLIVAFATWAYDRGKSTLR